MSVEEPARGQLGAGLGPPWVHMVLCCGCWQATEVMYRNCNRELSVHGYEPHEINGNKYLEDGTLGLLALS